MELIKLKNVTKHYNMGDAIVRALDGVDISIFPGEYLSIVGPSGSGKSTLMHILGFMDSPSGGFINFNGEDVTRISANRRAALRADGVGFVFQSFNLLPRLNVLENVMLPFTYSRNPPRNLRKVALDTLESVGLGHRSTHKISEISGGERQRTSIARALVNNPELILADEPTGNLDTQNAQLIIELLRDQHRKGKALIIVTHDLEIASKSPRIIKMRDGRICPDDISK